MTMLTDEDSRKIYDNAPKVMDELLKDAPYLGETAVQYVWATDGCTYWHIERGNGRCPYCNLPLEMVPVNDFRERIVSNIPNLPDIVHVFSYGEHCGKCGSWDDIKGVFYEKVNEVLK